MQSIENLDFYKTLSLKEKRHLSRLSLTEVDKIFDEIDRNHDGRLSRREIARFLNKFFEPHTQIDVDVVLAAFHCESQGYIARDDFKSYVISKYQMYKSSFDEFDSNNDGYITAQDVERVIQRIGHHPRPQDAKAIANHVIRVMDAKRDGRISIDEFIRYFVLSPKKHIQQQFHYWSTFGFNETVNTDDLNDSEVASPVWVTLLAGTSAGIMSRTLTAPLDRIKTLRQANFSRHGGGPGVWETGREIISKDGFCALFRGNFTNCVKVVPQTCFRFLTYDQAKAHFCADPALPTFSERLACGGLAGLTSQTFIYPLEPVKTRLAICPNGTYRGMFDCMLKMWRHEGTRSLFKGLTPALVGIVPYSAMDLCLFNYTKDVYISHYDFEPSALVLLACGSFSGLVAQTFTYPLSLIRTRLQAQGMPGSRPDIVYKGTLDCATQVMRHEGMQGLFKGLIPNYMKAVPAGAIGFVAFEKTKLFIRQHVL